MPPRNSNFVSLLAAVVVLGSCSSVEPVGDAAGDLTVPMVTVSSPEDSSSDIAIGAGESNPDESVGEENLDERPVSDGVSAAGIRSEDALVDEDVRLHEGTVSAAPETSYGEDVGLACANVEIALIRMLEDPTVAELASTHAAEAIDRVTMSEDDRFTVLVSGLDGDPASAEWQQSARTFLDACEAAGYEVL